MDEFKSVRSGGRESGRSEIIGFESERYFLKAVYSLSFWQKIKTVLFQLRTVHFQRWPSGLLVHQWLWFLQNKERVYDEDYLRYE